MKGNGCFLFLKMRSSFWDFVGPAHSPATFPKPKAIKNTTAPFPMCFKKKVKRKVHFFIQKSVPMFQHRFLGDVFRLDPVTKAATGHSEKDDHCFTGHGTREGQVWLVCCCFIQVGGIRYVFLYIYIRFQEG